MGHGGRAGRGDGRRPGRRRLGGLLAGVVLLCAGGGAAGAPDPDALAAAGDGAASDAGLSDRVVAWRRDIHQHPELGNRETRTAALVAAHLESLGIETRTGVAHTGVVGVLRGGGGDGPVVALRADMDALPVTEAVEVPFASKVRSTYLGREVGVMHACGHDAHTAILMGVASVLAGLRDRLPGAVVFLFQPAEEGAPPGERGGARLMLEEGAFSDPRPDAVFGLHVTSRRPAGTIALRPGGAMASSDKLTIVVHGRQTHAAYPWQGVDPISVASRIVLALQAIPARQVDTRIPAVVSIGAIHGGVRHNIIPDSVELLGTLRALDPEIQREVHAWVQRTATGIAESADARAEVDIALGYPITWNDPDLTRRITPVLEAVAGGGRVIEALPATGAEDFSFYQQEVPGVYYWLGVRPPDVAADDAAPNHSPEFTVDESALPLGVRSLVAVTLDALTRP